MIFLPWSMPIQFPPPPTSTDNTDRTANPVPDSRSIAIDSRPPLHDRPAYEDTAISSHGSATSNSPLAPETKLHFLMDLYPNLLHKIPCTTPGTDEIRWLCPGSFTQFPQKSKPASCIWTQQQRCGLCSTTDSIKPQHPHSALILLQIKHPKRPRPHCTHCQKPGHYKDKCYFLHGFLPGYGKPRTSDSTNQIHKKQDSGSTSRPQTHQVSTTDSQLTQAQCQQLISMLTQQLQPTTDASTSDQPAVNNITGNIDPISPTSWILDSCATHHVCCHTTCFSSITNMSTNKHVTLPNGTSVNIEKSGTIILNSNITLYNVLYVPARAVHRSV
uniref:Retrovirus-related Pol polyprotein from transposon TNT 1-94-like beta-barrel domain-containing protein n=1 Tax=Cannabis sativa TaxID=3483 RepID=A0A803PYV4_CANSA